MVILSCTLLLLLAVHGSIQKSSPESLTYRAAVVELTSVFYRNDAEKTLKENAAKLVGYIKQASEQDVDIIVFPELTLPSLTFVERAQLASRANLIPDPSQNHTPCTNSSIPVDEPMKMIACAAEQNRIYVVVNLLEKEICSGDECPIDGINFYITSAVFDRKGQIIARYRKAHLLADYNLIGIPKISTFDTDFGVTFGNIICFDIMFEDPLLTLTRELNITDIIHPSGWFAETPFLTHIQVLTGWAYVEDVNILSSGHNKVELGNSGTGIFAGRQGVVTALISLGDHEEMLVADVLKKSKKTVTTPTPQLDRKHHHRNTSNDHEHPVHVQYLRGSDSDRFKWRYEKLDGFETRIILSNGSTVENLKHRGIECEFQLNVTNLSPPVTYRLLAYDGDHSCNGVMFIGIRTCAIVQCVNDTIDSCGHIHNSTATFDSISITANHVDNARTLMMPNTLRSDLSPLGNWTFDQYEQHKHIITTMSLTRPTQNLVTFGIWGRNFETDRI